MSYSLRVTGLPPGSNQWAAFITVGGVVTSTPTLQPAGTAWDCPGAVGLVETLQIEPYLDGERLPLEYAVIYQYGVTVIDGHAYEINIETNIFREIVPEAEIGLYVIGGIVVAGLLYAGSRKK